MNDKHSGSGDPRSVLTRPAAPPDFTVAYGDRPEQVADLRMPDPGGPLRPLVVLLHGGFWMVEWDRAHTGPLSVALAAAGYPVATLEYRRVGSPGGGWTGTFDDVADGVAQVPALAAAALGLDEIGDGRVIVLGHSAGGQLALWVAQRVADLTGIVALAPVADLARAYALGLGDGATAKLLGGGPDEVPDRYAFADPAQNLPIGVPTAIVHGYLDQQVPYELGRDFAASAASAGDEVKLFGLPEIEHFALIDPLSGAWDSVQQALASVTDMARG